MKKVMIALFLISGTVMAKEAKAQVSVNINIGSQPAWGPTGYDHADFYYLPDINCYYDISRSQFVYPNGNNWTYARTLPSRYRSVNLYNMYKVVVNRPNPYRSNQNDIRDYGRYKGMHNQAVIRDSRDSRYYASKGHPQHNQWVKDQKKGGTQAGPRDNGNSNRNNGNKGNNGNNGNRDNGNRDNGGRR